MCIEPSEFQIGLNNRNLGVKRSSGQQKSRHGSADVALAAPWLAIGRVQRFPKVVQQHPPPALVLRIHTITDGASPGNRPLVFMRASAVKPQTQKNLRPCKAFSAQEGG